MNSMIEYAVASRAKDNSPFSGDSYLIRDLPRGCLIGVTDGIGHGREAAEVAKAVIEEIAQVQVISLEGAFHACHSRLLRTRGAVLSLALIDYVQSKLFWSGVGNVDGILFRRNEHAELERTHIFLNEGTLGAHFTRLHISSSDLVPTDLIVFFTDGIDGSFAKNLPGHYSAQSLADWILAGFNRNSDDALALVVKFLGG